jgi:hypothetical protein
MRVESQLVEEIVETLLAPDMETLEALEEGMLQYGWVKVKALVKKLLPDLFNSKTGSKHQRFVVQLGAKPGSPSVEVDHSLEAAPRAPVQPGEEVQVKGLYEPQSKVIHFTHRSREGEPAGFIFSPAKHWTVQ